MDAKYLVIYIINLILAILKEPTIPQRRADRNKLLTIAAHYYRLNQRNTPTLARMQGARHFDPHWSTKKIREFIVKLNNAPTIYLAVPLGGAV